MADLTLSPLIFKTIPPNHNPGFRSLQSKPSQNNNFNCRNLNELKQMHAQSTKNGLNQKPSFLTKLIVLCAEINTPESLEYATNAFEFSDYNQMNSVYAFNSLIRAYSSAGITDKAILIYLRLINQGLKPDHYTFPFLLSACAKGEDLVVGLQIHGSLVKMSLEHDLFIQNSLIHLYFECGEVEYGRKVFDEMSERNVVSWTSLICGLARSGQETEAISLFFEMVKTGISPNQVTMVAVVSACSKLMDLNLANKVSAYIIDSKLETNTILVNALVDMFLKCGDIDEAKKYFDKCLDKSLVLYNNMLSNYISRGLELEGFGLLDDMLKQGHRLDRITMLSAISASSRLCDLSFGRQCHGYVLRNGLDGISDSVSNAIMDMYTKCRKQDFARKIFDRLPRKTVVSWNIIIGGLVEEGLFEDAAGFFRLMQMEGVKPDKVTMSSVALACGWFGTLDTAKWIYGFVIKNGIEFDMKLCTSLVNMFAKCGDSENAMRVFDRSVVVDRDTAIWTAAIGAMAMGGNGTRALELFDEMMKEGFEPDGVTFVEVLTACSHAGLVSEGKRIFESINSPGVFHYGCIVDLLCRAGFLDEALDVIKNMSVEPNNVVWRALLAGCKTHKNEEIAAYAAERMDGRDIGSGTHILLSNTYAAVGKWDDVSRVRLEMREKGIRKTVGTSLISIEGVSHEFSSGNELHPEMENIVLMLDEMNTRLKEAGFLLDLTNVLVDVDEDEKAFLLSRHSEKLAIAFGLICTVKGAVIRVTKNLRICWDCHSFAKMISKIYDREIVIRDNYRFHFFKSGMCSCNDYW